MKPIKPAYIVKRLSNLAGVSVRTLHHYDEAPLEPDGNYRFSLYIGKREWLIIVQDPHSIGLDEHISSVRDQRNRYISAAKVVHLVHFPRAHFCECVFRADQVGSGIGTQREALPVIQERPVFPQFKIGCLQSFYLVPFFGMWLR